MKISFKEFQRLDMRIGKVFEAERIQGSRNLIKMLVDFDVEKRQSVAGLYQHYKPEELVNKKFVFLMNLENKRFMGVESQCMILAAEDDEANITLIKPEKDIKNSSRIK